MLFFFPPPVFFLPFLFFFPFFFPFFRKLPKGRNFFPKIPRRFFSHRPTRIRKKVKKKRKKGRKKRGGGGGGREGKTHPKNFHWKQPGYIRFII